MIFIRPTKNLTILKDLRKVLLEIFGQKYMNAKTSTIQLLKEKNHLVGLLVPQ